MENSKLNINQILKKYYGYDNFRPSQEELINSIISKKDTLAIMPTGAGKSICYQVPAIFLDGTTIVISPLISLMKDQVDSLNQIGVMSTYINSTLTKKEYDFCFKKAREGFFKIIYVAPERLETEEFVELLNNINISQIAIDEAHCVSQWGHDFRTSYKKIASVIDKIKKRPVVSAFTATATDIVREDIINLLNLKDPYIKITSFDRKNLYFNVETPKDKKEYIKNYILNNKEDSGIIYCTTRKNVDSLFEYLENLKINVTKYHAGLSESNRTKNQDDFIYDRKNVMIATNAFGMGIDKPDIRFVIHYNMPATMENYYQEAGRAGRDNLDSNCIILFSRSDVVTNKFLIEQGHGGNIGRNIEYEKLNKMVDYCNTDKCLRKCILEYFGEKVDFEKCNKCKNCNTEIEVNDITVESQKILSCVKRMNERFGTTLVCDVLKGSKNKKVKELHFDELSTYGALREYSTDLIKEIIYYLISENYIENVGTKFPVLKLNENSNKILFENKKISIKKIIKKEENNNNNLTNKINKELFNILREVRFNLSSLNNVPPYIIFSDIALKQMAQNYPLTKDEMLNITGVGEKKFEKYGSYMIEEIIKYVKDNNIDLTFKDNKDNLKDLKSKSNTSSLDEKNNKKNTYEITYNMIKEGRKLNEIVEERKLAISTIQGHFLKFIEEEWEGYEKIEKYLLENEIKKENVEKVKEILKTKHFSSLSEIKNSLPDNISYLEIRYALLRR